jgi:hypothetical protein
MNAAGDRVAIGAFGNDGSGSEAGHVRVYSWNGSAWVQLGSDIDGEAVGDQSGYRVSMNAAGDRVAIGAFGNDGSGSEAGHVRVYSWNGSAWVQLGSDIDGEAVGDQSGWSVSMNATGDRVAIGAVYNDGSGSNAGHVRVYSWNGSAWVQLGSDIDGEAAGDISGLSVSMNAAGDRVAIGATGNDGSGDASGHVRVYEWNGSAWTQLGADIDGEAAIDLSGFDVSLNAAGDRVAIGATGNDGSGSEAGHVRVYSWNGSVWVKLGADIDGEGIFDSSGYSVSMNADGDRVAIGAPYNNGSGSSAGHVRVYGAPTNLSYQWTLPQTNGTVVVSDNPLISIATVVQTANTVASRDDGGRLRATQLRLHGPTYYSQLNFSPSPTGNTSFAFPNSSGTVALISVAQTFTGLQQFSTRPRSSAALTPANTTELITLADGDSRYGAFYNGVSIPQVSSTNTTPIKVASVILPIGVYQIDSLVASVHGTVGLCTIGLKTSQTARITAFENYGNDDTAHKTIAIASDNFAGASQRSATSGGTFSRRVTGIIEIITASTELSIEYSQATTDAIASLTRKRAYITATKLS